MTQKEFHSLEGGHNQNAIIYHVLLVAGGQWVRTGTLRTLARSARIPARIHDLRKMGVPIEGHRTSDHDFEYRLKGFRYAAAC